MLNKVQQAISPTPPYVPAAWLRASLGLEELKAAFHESVDDYLASCARIGKAPDKPYSGKVMFRIDPAVHAKAALAAQLKGVSLNQWAEEVMAKAAQ